MNTTQKTLLLSAVAGILGVAAAAGPSMAAEKKMKDGGKADKSMSTNKCAAKAADSVECYGVNACSGKGKCGGEGHGCAGSNSCKGQGWLPMPKDSCLAIEGGSLTPVKKG